MTKQLLVIALLSNDQPGVVKQVADIINQHHGNWLESRMSQLSGKFAGILTVSVASDQAEALTQALMQLTASGLQLLIDRADLPTEQPGKQFTFELVGADREGIVSELSQAFTEQGINIDELETHCSSMPWSGEPLFEATGTLLAPTETNTERLLCQLHDIEDKLGIDIQLNAHL